MRILPGTSGFAYDQWKGSFYPDGTSSDEMLGLYAQHFATVEINNTFYRVPKRDVVASWAAAVPDSFRFVLKLSRRVTHQQRLRATDETRQTLHYFHRSSLELGKKLGAILIQLPPFLKADPDLLATFLELLPQDWPVAFEFRHVSWDSDAIHTALREHGAGVVLSDDKGALPPSFPQTSSFGYLRLRGEAYEKEALADIVMAIRATPWQHAFVMFKHEDDAPALATALGRIT